MLLTKLHIPTPFKDTIHRQELFNLLDQAQNKKLVLVSAPAGYGKTTLISDWIIQNKISAVWCSIDKRDNDPIEFLKLVVTAIQKQHNEFGESAMELLKTPGTASVEYISELFINDLLKLESETVLVLDDLHLITNKQVFHSISTLIDYKPPNLLLVLSTRSDPPLSFSRLRSQNEMLELRATDLSFSNNDISFLFNRRLKVKLTENDLNILQQKTEGWIAGLQLTAITVQGQNDISGYLKKMAGDNRYIMDYLIEEVLHNQPGEFREFLLKTSVLDQFNAPLCNYILQIEHSQQILEEFEKNNLFIIPLDFEKRWFRYHHLFADLLKHHLLFEFKNEIEKIHLQASEWFFENNFVVESIEHAFKAGSNNKAIEILNEHVESLWVAGQHSVIIDFGEKLTEEKIILNPRFCIFYSWMLITAGKTNEAQNYLNATEKVLVEQQNSKDDFQDILGKLSLTYALLYAILGQKNRVIQYSDQAIKNLSDKNPLWNGWAYLTFGDAYHINANLAESEKFYLLAVEYGRKAQNQYLEITANFRLALCFGRHGKYKSAFKICKEQLDIIHAQKSKQLATEYYLTGFYLLYGDLLFEWNECEEGKKYIEKGFELSKKANDISVKVYSYVAIIHLYFSLGEMDKASEKLLELETDPEYSQTTPWLSIHITAWKAELLMQKGELEKASEILTAYEENLDEEIIKKPEYIQLRLVKLYILQRKPEKALKVIDSVLNLAYNHDKHYSKFYGYVLKAEAYIVLNNKTEAKKTICKALQLAQEEDYIRLFIEERDILSNLLFELWNDKKITSSVELDSISDTYFSKLIQALNDEKRRVKEQVDGILTSREIETLQLIARDLTNQEIADQLFISLNTVKTRLKNIFLKLEVDSRRKAVEKSKDQGLI